MIPVSSTHRMSWVSKKRSTTFCSAEHVPSSWSDQQGKGERVAWQFLFFKLILANVTGTPDLNLKKHFEQTLVYFLIVKVSLVRYLYLSSLSSSIGKVTSLSLVLSLKNIKHKILATISCFILSLIFFLKIVFLYN